MLILLKIETIYIEASLNKVIKTDLSFHLYSRNISNDLLNRDYKINKININRELKKHAFEYQSLAGRAEKILGHKVLAL